MKTDETVVFDYLKPDFSILKERRLVWVNIQPEYVFYFKHRIIHWMNQLNESCEPDINFDNVIFNRYMIGHTGTVSAVYGIGNRSGNIYFNYDHDDNNSQKEFQNVSFHACQGLYKNNKKFPNSSHLFNTSFTADNNYEMIEYEVERTIDLTDLTCDDFVFYYTFNNEGVKIKTQLIMYDNIEGRELVFKDNAVVDKDDQFDSFLNDIIVTIIKAIPTFLELYPQLEITQIEDNDSFKKFYESMKKLYNDGVFDEGLEDNLALIRMLTI